MRKALAAFHAIQAGFLHDEVEEDRSNRYATTEQNVRLLLHLRYNIEDMRQEKSFKMSLLLCRTNDIRPIPILWRQHRLFSSIYWRLLRVLNEKYRQNNWM